jgi:uncharacterized protein (DUF1697 family)
MTAMICLLRGVNVGGHNQIKMDALRALCESLKLCNVQTYIQSGNVVFQSREINPAKVAAKIEDALEKQHGFRPDVVLRTAAEMRDVISRSPFSKRKGIEPNKLAVMFLDHEPEKVIQDAVRKINPEVEELHLLGRELYIYFPNGMGRSKLVPLLARALKNAGTARNWNTVVKLLDMAEGLEQTT